MALGKLLKKTCQVNLGLKLKFHKYTDLQILTSVEMNVTFFFKFLIPVGKGEGKKAIFPVRDLGDLVFCTVCSLSALLEMECESKTGQKLLLQRRRFLWL